MYTNIVCSDITNAFDVLVAVRHQIEDSTKLVGEPAFVSDDTTSVIASCVESDVDCWSCPFPWSRAATNEIGASSEDAILNFFCVLNAGSMALLQFYCSCASVFLKKQE